MERVDIAAFRMLGDRLALDLCQPPPDLLFIPEFSAISSFGSSTSFMSPLDRDFLAFCMASPWMGSLLGF